MGIPLPYPDGQFVEEVSLFTPTNFPQQMLPAQPNRIYLGVAASIFGLVTVGFTSAINAGASVGLPLPLTGMLTWLWKDVGPLVGQEFFVDDNGALTTFYVEQVINWPAGSLSPEAIEASRLKARRARVKALQKLRKRLSEVKSLVAQRTANV